MIINKIIQDAKKIADIYNLKFVEIDRTDMYIFTDNKKSMQEFVQESMRFLEEKGIL